MSLTFRRYGTLPSRSELSRNLTKYANKIQLQTLVCPKKEVCGP